MKRFRRYLFPIFFGLVIYATVRAVNDTTAGERFWERPLQLNLIEISAVVLVSYCIQFMLNYFIRKFSDDGPKPITTQTVLREFGAVFLGNFIIVNAVIIPMAALTGDGLQVNDFVIAHVISGLYVLLYFAIARGNYYLKSYVDQRLKLEKMTNDHLQTELKFLKAQYHPHFLFNALNTVYFQMDEDKDAAKSSIEKFAGLLRYQLYDQQQTVPVIKEIEYLQNFIDLQKVRASEKLQLKVTFDLALNRQHIYPLLLLPAVENAFKYVGGNMYINIAVESNAAQLIFRVENGLPDLAALPVHRNEGGIGLDNLKRRLELLYPGKYTLDIDHTKDHFNVTMVLPTLQESKHG